MPSVTDWISSISSLIGGLTGIGALVVAVLSYKKSQRALEADARTRGAVSDTLEAVQTLGQESGLGSESQPGDQHLTGERYENARGDDRARSAAFEAALLRARVKLEQTR